MKKYLGGPSGALTCSLLLLLATPCRAAEDAPASSAAAPAVDEGSGEEPASSDSEASGEKAETVSEEAWRDAASPEQQAQARALFREGNSLVKESLFIQAAEKYEQALEIWDHPGIHYNLALALLNLDQPLRLRQHLLGSLKYGEQSLGEDKARRAEQYLSLVEKQLSRLVITSAHKGAKVKLDGELIFTAPGKYEDHVRAGQHRVLATSPGFEPTERPLTLVPGEQMSVEMKLYKPEDWLRYDRRWNKWGPIVTTASGALVLGAGALVLWQGTKQTKAYDQEVLDQCPQGCLPGEISKSAGGETVQTVGVITMAVGASVAVTGGVLLYMNRQIASRVDPGAKDNLSFIPVIGSDFAGFVSRGTF